MEKNFYLHFERGLSSRPTISLIYYSKPRYIQITAALLRYDRRCFISCIGIRVCSRFYLPYSGTVLSSPVKTERLAESYKLLPHVYPIAARPVRELKRIADQWWQRMSNARNHRLRINDGAVKSGISAAGKSSRYPIGR